MEKSSHDTTCHSPQLCKNRFEVLGEIQEMLGFSDMEWKGLFSLIRKTSGGFPSSFEFKFGDFGIDLFVEPEEKQVVFNIQKRAGAKRKEWSYTYKLTDLDFLWKLGLQTTI